MKSTGVVVILRDDFDDYLFQLRDDIPGIAYPGMMALFGGLVESGEKPLDAMVREVGEELVFNGRGLVLNDLKFLFVYQRQDIERDDYVFFGTFGGMGSDLESREGKLVCVEDYFSVLDELAPPHREIFIKYSNEF